MSFTGKIVIITGASSGIGEGTAVEFSKLGASLVLAARNMENLKKTEQKCKSVGSNKVLLVQADVTKDADLKRIIEETVKTFGRIDVLVNNAGIGIFGSIENGSMEQYELIFRTNLRSVYYLSSLAVPHLIKSKGCIVNISSTAGLRAFPGAVAYCMSKAALDHFTRCTALDLAPKQVRVNSVNPGVIISELQKRAGMSEADYQKYLERCKDTTALGRVGTPEEVAKAIIFLASDSSSFITGETIAVDGGKQVMCPR